MSYWRVRTCCHSAAVSSSPARAEAPAHPPADLTDRPTVADPLAALASVRPIPHEPAPDAPSVDGSAPGP
ncbi:hypothetical protein FTUN_1767 [Frigoriglobus tundricola]|uniref:Uncharacterized protein n=1 Tax=Frigoriglobus tundricola TaxID=2774151 RepID=A0A6M5YJK4_9BACT|nr:hypothetical protein FTUN_1767 [Frigoriglobus tundricola]